MDIVRSLFLSLDQILYGFIPTVYDFIMVLARVQVFPKGTIEQFASNIYAVLGLFMLFKLSFSLITYIVNPDALFDEKKGLGKIISRSLIALVLIVAIPYAFQWALRVQNMVINNGIITKIILGSNEGAVLGEGTVLSSQTLQAFITCYDCTDPNDADALKFAIQDPRDLSQMANIITKRNGNGDYIYSYTFGLSTIAGGFVLFMLVMYSFDIALRTVKLGFLQLISPVAVVSYVDPKSGQDGFFSRWLKMSLTTYMNLFIRILAIAFMVFIVHQLPNIYSNIKDYPENYGIVELGDPTATSTSYSTNDNIEVKPLSNFDNSTNLNGLEFYTIPATDLSPTVKQMYTLEQTPQEVDTLATFIVIFIIIGVLMFVKEAPKLLQELFGLKEDGLGTFKSPLKRMFGGAAIGAVGGFAAGLGMKTAGGLGGALGGGFRSAIHGAGFKNTMKNMGRGFAGGAGNVKMGDKFGKQFGGMLGAERKANADLIKYNKMQRAHERSEARGSAYAKANKYDPWSIYSNKFANAVNAKGKAKDDMIKKQNELTRLQHEYMKNPSGMAYNMDGSAMMKDGKQMTLFDAYNSANKDYQTYNSRYEAADKELNELVEDPAFASDAKRYKAIKEYTTENPDWEKTSSTAATTTTAPTATAGSEVGGYSGPSAGPTQTAPDYDSYMRERGNVDAADNSNNGAYTPPQPDYDEYMRNRNGSDEF